MAAPSRNAAYQRVYRQRIGEEGRRVEAKQQAINRIRAGLVPQAATMERFGITPEEVNRIRAAMNLGPAVFTNRRGRRILHLEDPPSAPAAAPRPPAAPSAPVAPPRPPAAPSAPVAAPRPPAAPSAPAITLRELLDKIGALRGSAQLAPNGAPARTKAGQAKKLTDNTVKQMGEGIKLLAATTGCGEAEDFGACLRDAGEVLRKVRARYPLENSFKKALGSLVSAAKYVPEFGAALGEAREVYRQAMIGSIRAAEEQAIQATETASVPAIDEIRGRIPAIAQRFGETSLEHIAARLQALEAIGIRDDLGGVKVVSSEVQARAGGVKNFFVPRTGKLVIADYKTSTIHNRPYEFKLTEGLAGIIRRSLAEKRREYLIGKGSAGRVLKRAFEGAGLPGIGVNTLRHSLITDLLREGGAGAANIRRVAHMFRHSPEMTTRYVRGETPPDRHPNAPAPSHQLPTR